jgi:hypothetical protein
LPKGYPTIIATAAKELAMLTEGLPAILAEQIEGKDVVGIMDNADAIYSNLGMARMLCETLLHPDERDTCLLPVWKVENDIKTKLQEQFKK